MLQPVRGTHDIWGYDKKIQRLLGDILRSHAELNGYEEIETPIFEYTKVFHRLGDSSDILAKETYTFLDRGQESLTLRPEGTAAVVRAIISNKLTQNLPGKYYYVGPMFRYDRPQKGRYRQLNQFGVELIGVDHYLGDVEIIALTADIMAAINLQDRVVLEINSLGSPECRQKYQAALVSYFDKFKSDLSQDSLRRLQSNPLRILDSKEQQDQEIVQNSPPYKNYLSSEACHYFEQVLNCLAELNIEFVVNSKLVRGLDYYCHTVFEFTATELGAQKTVAAGGRFNGLFKEMAGPDLSGVGVAAGIERLLLLADLNVPLINKVVLLPLGDQAEFKCLQVARDLRGKGITTELIAKSNLSKNLSKANKMKAKFAVIIGNDELSKNEAQLKNLDTGDVTVVSIDQLTNFFKNVGL